MQSRPQADGLGLVKWVVPQSRGSRKDAPGHHSGEIMKSNNVTNPNYSNSKVNIGSTKTFRTNSDAGIDGEDMQPAIDLSMCRTICTFIKEHLRELQEHQLLINKARSKLVNTNMHNLNELVDTNLMTRNDIWRLKVRDEQTNAIETIKRLTDYLRELTNIENQCNSTQNLMGDDIIDRLSDIRMEIIQALNDFVLSNSDIDVPIIHSDDNNLDYDLCTDAPSPTKNYYKSRGPAASNSCDWDESNQNSSTFTDSPSITRDDFIETAEQNQRFVINSKSQLINLEKRRGEVEKLERDTEELRRLFSDFYGLIKTQGEQVSTIEDNIVITTQRISEGQHNMNKAMKSLTILMPVTGCMAGAIIGGPLGLIIGGKLGGVTIGCASSLVGLLSSYSIQRCISTNKVKND